jgi:hypothetical protein
MTDYLQFKRWLGFYRPDVRLLSWQAQAAKFIFRQPLGAGRNFFIRLLAEYNSFGLRSEQRKMDLGE